MNILIIRNYPSYMSVKNNTYNIQEVGLAKALVRRGHKCDIVFWTDKAEEILEIPVSGTDNKTVTIYYRNGKTALKNTVFDGCDDLFDWYDILQPCEYNQIEAWYLARKYPKKTVIYHGPYYSDFNKRYNLACKLFDFFLLKSYKKRNTQFIVKSKLAGVFLEGKGLSNIDSIGVGIDAEMLFNKNEGCNEKIYAAIKGNLNDYKILYIGRFENRRNIPFLLDVFRKVKDALPNTTLYMIGTGDQDYIDDCWRHAKEVGVYDSIVWQERIEQKYLAEIYKLSDCFVLPTRYEIFGMVLIEAMYYKNLVVTNMNGGSSSLIENDKNGIVIDSWNSNEWASIIVKQLRDKESRLIMTNAAHMTIEESFTWDKLAPFFERSYLRRIQGEF